MKPEILNVPADLETPVSAFLKLRDHGAKFLLESAEQGERLGRFTFIGMDAWETIRIAKGKILRNGEEVPTADPLGDLRKILAAERLPVPLDLPGPVGGAVGYFSYDFVRYLETLPSRLPDPLGLPDAEFSRCATTVIFDHFRRRMTLVGLRGGPERLREIAGLLQKPLVRRTTAPAGAEFRDEFGRPAFLKAVEKAQEHIRAGDIFQGVISRRETRPYGGDPFSIYRALRILNPSPYMFYLDFGDHQLVGSSPEVHAKLTRGRALIRPIAGTRPRGETDEADLAAEKELLADPKERAEHLMLIDLARNDLGRTCAYGSISCKDLYSVERYSHVMHLASQVEGTLRPGADAFDLVGTTLPAGTVSGAPKIRAMEIIDELEPVRRGPYAGAAGYFAASGDMDFCISLRTLVLNRGTAYLQAGAGIVLDSKPESEWDETTRKMQVLKDAILMAEREL